MFNFFPWLYTLLKQYLLAYLRTINVLHPLNEFLNKSFYLILIRLSQHGYNFLVTTSYGVSFFYFCLFQFINFTQERMSHHYLLLYTFLATFVSITDSRFRSFFTFISFKRFNFSLRIVMILTQTRFVHSR